jgi:hypothetical protein
MKILEAIYWIAEYKRAHLDARKEILQAAFAEESEARQQRSVFVGDNYAIRFSEANTGSFSSVVLSLSALQRYDASPMVICIVRPEGVDFRLANTTFLRRISHSSHTLRTDNIKGSFLGHDIMDEFEGIPNRPEHFEGLFALHSAFTWEENVARLVEATNAIVARDTRFKVTEGQRQVLLAAPARAAEALATQAWAKVERELAKGIERDHQALLRAARIDNVNIRGNEIEQLITGDVNAHRLDDLVFELPTGGTLIVDIKTKLLDRPSAPKAYNIDKFLALLSQVDNAFAFFFIGLDASSETVVTRLVSVFDPVILNATRIQHHWAGRSSRGVTQLTGELGRIFFQDYRPSIDIKGGKTWLRELIER